MNSYYYASNAANTYTNSPTLIWTANGTQPFNYQYQPSVALPSAKPEDEFGWLRRRVREITDRAA